MLNVNAGRQLLEIHIPVQTIDRCVSAFQINAQGPAPQYAVPIATAELVRSPIMVEMAIELNLRSFRSSDVCIDAMEAITSANASTGII